MTETTFQAHFVYDLSVLYMYVNVPWIEKKEIGSLAFL